jgi:tetratricopeptide (TPR) repeat protein
MKRKECLLIGTLLLLLLSCSSAWPQPQTGTISGVIMLNKMERAPNLQVVVTSRTTGKDYKTKTDKKGQFLIAGLQIDDYNLTVLGANGDVLYVNETRVKVRGPGTDDLEPIDLSDPAASKGRAGTPADAGNATAGKMTKEQQKAHDAQVKADNEKIARMNEFIGQYQAAAQAQKWPDAEKALQQLLTLLPDTTRWEFYKALGDAQGRNNELPEAIQTYDKGIRLAEAIVAGKAPADPRNPNPDPAKAKAGIGQMLIAEGNIYVKLQQPEMATPLFQQATLDNPNPGLAYYNLCAVEFNANKMPEAVSACSKSIASDPARADAWFFKGAALFKEGPTATTKGDTVAALNKYLELDPQGQHVSEAKSMLETVQK